MNPSSQIPFLKFQIDPREIEGLELIRSEEIEPAEEPESLYMFKNKKSGNTYCVWEKDMNLSSNIENDIMSRFMAEEFTNYQEIHPKHDDWYQTHWLYLLT